MAGLILLGSFSAAGQAPPVLWNTNLGARLFAVDAQTNLYANAGGTVIKLTGAGVPVQTNMICPLPGFAQRDDAGSLYFAGNFNGTQDFGGITLVSAQVSGFLAKYGPSGLLQWVKPVGYEFDRSDVDDLLVDPSDGAAYIGFEVGDQDFRVWHFSSLGSNQWSVRVSQLMMAIKLGGLTPTNCTFIGNLESRAAHGRIDLGGTLLGPWYDIPLGQRHPELHYARAKPVIDDLGRMFKTADCYYYPQFPDVCSALQFLLKYDGATELWRVPIGEEPQWTLARDGQANIYLGGAYGLLAKYTSDGQLVWASNYGQPCTGMIVDVSGNRFVSRADGTIARLGAEVYWPPAITNAPQGLTVLTGDNATLSVGATGTLLRYYWLYEGAHLPGATNAVLSYTKATPTQAGLYSVIVSNFLSAVTSAPVRLRVKYVQLYAGSLMLTNGWYFCPTIPTLTVRSVFTNGAAFYTLDGSTPYFGSTPYTQPFTVTQDARIRAIGYSADFVQSEEADAVNVVFLTRHPLAVSATGGGSVSLNPPGGSYVANETVVATATAAPGWTFLYWLGDAAGASPVVNLSMERDKTIRAVFGTTLSATVAGAGQIVLSPPGGVYAHGATVQLTAVPQPGNYFGLWGNAASGNTNPLYFTITTPNPTVSSIFGSTPVGQAALTVQISGRGHVNVLPRANVFILNTPVTLTAVPEAGQSFVNWSGDASGTQNPLVITMSTAKVIAASFTARPSLRVSQPGLEGLTPDGFRLTLVSDPLSVHQLRASTNLSVWESLVTLTNTYGEVQFTDTNAPSFSRRFYQAAP